MFSCELVCKFFSCITFINYYSLWSSRSKIHVNKEKRISFFLSFGLIFFWFLLLWWFFFLVFVNLLFLLFFLFILFLLWFLGFSFYNLRFRILLFQNWLLFHFFKHLFLLCLVELSLSLSICCWSSFLWWGNLLILLNFLWVWINFRLEARLFIFKFFNFLWF